MTHAPTGLHPLDPTRLDVVILSGHAALTRFVKTIDGHVELRVKVPDPGWRAPNSKPAVRVPLVGLCDALACHPRRDRLQDALANYVHEPWMAEAVRLMLGQIPQPTGPAWLFPSPEEPALPDRLRLVYVATKHLTDDEQAALLQLFAGDGPVAPDGPLATAFDGHGWSTHVARLCGIRDEWLQNTWAVDVEGMATLQAHGLTPDDLSTYHDLSVHAAGPRDAADATAFVVRAGWPTRRVARVAEATKAFRADRDLPLAPTLQAGQALIDAGLTINMMVAWLAAHVSTPEDVTAWQSAGFSPQDARPWALVGVRADMARLWMDADTGVDAYRQQWAAAAGLDPAMYAQWADAVGDMDTLTWHRTGATLDLARRLSAAGLQPVDYTTVMEALREVRDAADVLLAVVDGMTAGGSRTPVWPSSPDLAEIVVAADRVRTHRPLRDVATWLTLGRAMTYAEAMDVVDGLTAVAA